MGGLLRLLWISGILRSQERIVTGDLRMAAITKDATSKMEEYANIRKVVQEYRELRILLEATRHPEEKPEYVTYGQYRRRTKRPIKRVSYW